MIESFFGEVQLRSNPAESARAIYVTAIGETNSRREATLIDLHQLDEKLQRRRKRGDVVAAVLLLLAIVAAIALTMRKRKDNKWVDPAEQVKVRRNDRIRMVKMAAEPRVERGGETNNDNAAA